MTGRGNEIPVEGSDGLRRAVNLLLLLSRMDFSAEQKRLIAEEIRLFDEWKQFAGLAVRHGVAALIWQNLSDLGHAGEVPKAERNILEGLRFKSIARVSWITEAAARVTALLEREGIKVVLLKGLALEHTVYGSKGLRQMSDADLLVAPADALRARDILIRDGFRSMSLKSPLYRHIILDLGNHLPELHRGGISVDLHYRLFGPEGEEMVERAIRDSVIITGVDREPGRTAAVTRESEDGVGVSSGTDAAVNSGTGTPGAVASSESGAPGNGTGARPGLIGDAESSPITSSGVGFPDTALSSEAGTPGGALSTGTPGAGTFRILPPMTAFLALVNHIYKHEIKGEFQLRLWTDIYLLLVRYGKQILTSGLADAAEEAGIRKETVAVLTVMKQVWGVVLPEGMAVSSDAENAVVALFMNRLAHPESVGSITQREMFMKNLRALKSPLKKFIFILGDIFPSIGFMKRRYNCRSKMAAFLFYPHRLGKILWILGLLRTEKYDT